MALLKLDETRWVLGGGTTSEWNLVNRRRLDEAYAKLAGVAKRWRSLAPEGAKRRGYAAGLEFFVKNKGAARDALAVHPALDYWLHLWDTHFARPTPPEDWDLHFGIFQSFPASLALATGKAVKLDGCLDPDGRFYLYGTPWFVDLGPQASRAPAKITIAKGSVKVEAAGSSAVIDPKAAPKGAVKKLVEMVPGVVVDDRGWLLMRGVTMHGLEVMEEPARRRFAEVIAQAWSELKERDPFLHAEMADLLRVLVPLQNPMNHGSVSSSYVTMRGLIALSHAEDSLLQAETLIHEFCHMKMNQLLAADPVLLPGQSGQVYYSPWRKDARRLRGLMLGAHAFLNVARYLSRSLEREEYDKVRRLDVMSNVARRVLQVEAALKSLIEHGKFTEFGREFILGMWRELGVVRHAALWYPEALVAEQKDACEQHRRENGLGDTALHKLAGTVDVPRDRFRKPGQPEEDEFLPRTGLDAAPAAAPEPKK